MDATRATDPRDAMALYERSAQQRAEAKVEQEPARQRREDTAEISAAGQQLASQDPESRQLG